MGALTVRKRLERGFGVDGRGCPGSRLRAGVLSSGRPLLDGLDRGSPCVTEEIFGPVLLVLRV